MKSLTYIEEGSARARKPFVLPEGIMRNYLASAVELLPSLPWRHRNRQQALSKMGRPRQRPRPA